MVAAYQAHGAAINALAIGDGLAATAGDDGLLRVWPLDFAAPLLESEHGAPVTAAAFAPGGLAVAAGCEDGVLGVLDVAARRFACAVRSHTAEVLAAAARPGGREFCTAAADGTGRVWDAAALGGTASDGGGNGGGGGQLFEFRVAGDGAATAAAYHPVRHELALGSEGGRVRVFDVATASLLADRRLHAARVRGAAFSPDGARLITWADDGSVVVADAARGTYAPLRALPPHDPLLGLPRVPAAAALSPDGATLVVTAPPRRRTATREPAADGGGGVGGENDGNSGNGAAAAAPYAGSCLLVFDADTLEARACIETRAPGFARLLFSADGASLWGLSAAADGDVLRFDAATGRVAQRIAAPHRHGCFALAAAPCGRRLYTGGGDGLVKAWAVAPLDAVAAAGVGGGRGGRAAVPSRNPPHQAFVGHPGAVRDLALVGDGCLVACGGGDAVTLWRVAPPLAQEQQREEQQQQLDGVANSGGGGEACTGMDVTMRSWLDAAAAGGDPAAVAAAAAEPSPLYAAGAPGSPARPAAAPLLRAAPASAGAPRIVGFGAASAACVAWDRGRGRLVYAADGAVVIEDLATRAQALLQHPAGAGGGGPVTALALGDDGRLLATAVGGGGGGAASGGSCGEVCLWDVGTRRLLHVLQRPAGSGSAAFTRLAFSVGDGCAWLAAASSGPAAGVAVWSTADGAPAAAGRANGSDGDIRALAWLPHRALPEFVTGGGGGLLQWTLAPQFLEQRRLTLPGAGLGTAVVALATAAAGHDACEGERDAASRNVFAAGDDGVVWRGEVGEGLLLRSARVAALPTGEAVTALRCAPAADTLVVATDAGRVLRFTCAAAATAAGDAQGCVQEEHEQFQSQGPAAPWRLDAEVALDGAVAALEADPAARLNDCLVTTRAATAFRLDIDAGRRAPLVCGHAGEVRRLWALDAAGGSGGGAAIGGGILGGLMASVAGDGALRVWRLGGASALPAVELACDAAATAVAVLPEQAPADAGPQHHAAAEGGGQQQLPLPRIVVGYEDGALRLFDLRRRAVLWGAAARRPSPVVAVAAHPSRPVLLSASRDGALALTHADTGRLLASCGDFAPAVTPLHALALAAPCCGGHEHCTAAPQRQSLLAAAALPQSSSLAGLAAAAWLDRVAVFEAPWREAAAAAAAGAQFGSHGGGGGARVVWEYRCPSVPAALPPGAESRAAFLPPDARLLAFTSPCLGARALLLDAASGAPLRQLELGSAPAALAVAPMVLGGRASRGLVAFGLEDGGVVLTDAEAEGSVALAGHGRAVRALAFCGGGELLVSAAGECMWVWRRDGLRSAATGAAGI